VIEACAGGEREFRQQVEVELTEARVRMISIELALVDNDERGIIDLIDLTIQVDEGAGLQGLVRIEVGQATDPTQALVGRRYQAQLLAVEFDVQILSLAGLKSKSEKAPGVVNRVAEVQVGPADLSDLGVARDSGQGCEAEVLIEFEGELARVASGDRIDVVLWIDEVVWIIVRNDAVLVRAALNLPN
jgi:hypothetical protein